VNKRKICPEFGPGADYHQFAIGVASLDNLSHGGRSNVLAETTLDLKNAVFSISH
jgi:hypothetical protein